MRPRLPVVVPEGVRDPRRPSGGNTYDRRLCEQLQQAGWQAELVEVEGGWPAPDGAARHRLCERLRAVPDGRVVVVDGLLASGVPEVVVPEAARLRLVVLLHLPLGLAEPSGRDAEQTVLRSVAGVVTTSGWARDWVLGAYELPSWRVRAVRPGADRADPARGTGHGGRLLCVGAVTPAKGHADLLAALATVATRATDGDTAWVCRCVGPLDRDPGFVDRLRRDAATAGLADRFVLLGPLDGEELAAEYAAADALLLASRLETYGMVATEALSRGLPVLVSDVGGLPEAVGLAPDGSRPGMLVPPGDDGAWGAAVARWLSDPDLRHRLRASALARRGELAGWDATARGFRAVLAEVAA